VIVEVESNPNCERSLFIRFKEAGPPRRVAKVRVFERRAEGEWCWVTGWSDDPDRPTCPAYAQLVEDSGAGLAYLIYGGLYGIRMKPVAVDEEWTLDSVNQWGEPYLSLADRKDLEYAADGNDA
jgi:hypothetical protein